MLIIIICKEFSFPHIKRPCLRHYPMFVLILENEGGKKNEITQVLCFENYSSEKLLITIQGMG